MIKAVIFDLDGTLVDTPPVYVAAYMDVLGKLDLRPDERMIREKFGKRATDIMAELLTELGVEPGKVEVTPLIDAIRDVFIRRIKDILVLPGAVGLLGKLGRDYKLGLATCSRPYAAYRILDRFKLKGYFQAIVTGDDVARSKPDPEIFLKAAKMLGIEPKECVVVEDAVYGIEAARAAGMRAIAVATGSSSREELEKANPYALLDSLEAFDFRILN